MCRNARIAERFIGRGKPTTEAKNEAPTAEAEQTTQAPTLADTLAELQEQENAELAKAKNATARKKIHAKYRTLRKEMRREAQMGEARFSIGTLEDAQRKVNAWFEGVTRETVVDDIAKLVDEGAANGLIKIADDSEKLQIAIAARVFFDEYSKKIITLSDGRHVYFTPDERNLDRGLSKSESWATYCIHAVTHGGERVKKTTFNTRVWSPRKAENMMRIESIIAEENCRARLDKNPEKDRVIFVGKDLSGERIDIVTKLDEYGNIDADLTEITAVMTGGKMPPLDNEPLTEAVRLVAIHQADGYSRPTDTTIAHHGENVNGESSRPSVTIDPEARAQAQREYHEVVAQYKGTGQWLKAPNGKPTNLTERQWVQVRTPSFKKWFGDWGNDPANASKVVDENGEPIVVYRGAPYDPLAQEAEKGVIAPERYFTPDEQYAKRYEKGDGVTRAYFVNIRNPFDVRNERDVQRNLAQLIRDAKVAVDEVKSPASITSRSRRLLRKWQNTKRMAPHP